MSEERGSEKLLQELFGGAAPASEAEVARAFGIQVERAKILGWWIRGQPKPDWFHGKFQVTIDDVGPAIASIVKQGFIVEGFPLGKPRPDWVLLNVQNLPRGF